MPGEATRQQTDVASLIRGVLAIITCRLTSQSASARVTSVICEVMMKRFLAAALFLFPGSAQAEYFDTGDDLWNALHG
jgi:hypothetical protein